MATPFDALFRRTFVRLRQAAGLLRAVLPPPLVRAIDWTTLHPCPATIAGRNLRLHHTDLLFLASTAGADGSPVVLVLEHKSGPDSETAEQMLDYVLHIRQQWQDMEPAAGPPLIVPVVVYHGERPWPYPTALRPASIAGLDADAAMALARVQLDLQFVLVDLVRLGEEQIAKLSMPDLGRLVLLLLQVLRLCSPDEGEAALLRWASLVRAVDASPSGRGDKKMLWYYCLYLNELTAERLHAIVARILGRRDEESIIMSTAEKLIAKGRVEGRVEGRAELLLRLLTARFGTIPSPVVARVQAATATELDRWADRLLTAKTLDDLFA